MDTHSFTNFIIALCCNISFVILRLIILNYFFMSHLLSVKFRALLREKTFPTPLGILSFVNEGRQCFIICFTFYDKSPILKHNFTIEREVSNIIILPYFSPFHIFKPCVLADSGRGNWIYIHVILLLLTNATFKASDVVIEVTFHPFAIVETFCLEFDYSFH